MLSTAEALREWASVLKMLSKTKAQVAANPGAFTMPASLDKSFSGSARVLVRGLASPVSTWKQLLDKQVSTQDSTGAHRTAQGTVTVWPGHNLHAFTP